MGSDCLWRGRRQCHSLSVIGCRVSENALEIAASVSSSACTPRALRLGRRVVCPLVKRLYLHAFNNQDRRWSFGAFARASNCVCRGLRDACSHLGALARLPPPTGHCLGEPRVGRSTQLHSDLVWPWDAAADRDDASACCPRAIDNLCPCRRPLCLVQAFQHVHAS